MSLNDVDKTSQDRGDPTPNHNDQVIDGAIMAHKTVSTHYKTDADTTPGRIQMQNKQILGNDGTTNITLYGYNQALSKWGFFVTKPGVEVTTNTDLSKFIFNSGQDIFKIVFKGSTSITATNGINVVTVTHGLGYVPQVIAFVESGGVNSPLPFVDWFGGVVSGYLVVASVIDIVDIDSSVFFIRCISGSAYAGIGDVFPITYYLLQETAN